MKSPKTKKLNRRKWPVAKPCDCPACKSIRLQILLRHSPSTTK